MRAELALAVLCACLGVSAATPAQEPGRVVVGSKSFTESRLLSEMLVALLEEHTELEVEHRPDLGGTLVCFTALETGAIDVYPEYTGTGWAVILERAQRSSDPLQTFLTVQADFRARWDLEWLQPLGPNNTYAMAMREERAEELGIRTLSDAARHAPELHGGFSLEFLEREDGYPGLTAFYGLELASARGMEHGLVYQAVAAGEVDLIDAYSTDAKLLRYGLRVLEDDRAFFPPYDVAPLARGATLRAHPEISDALERLAFRITDQRMTELNHAVEEERRGFAEVAREFLVDEGLLEGSAEAARGDTPDTRRGGFLELMLERRGETLRLVGEHLQLTLLSVLLATALAIPLGIWATRSTLVERLSLGAAGVLQTIPSLALLAFMIAVPGLGLSARSAVAALFLYALLPILRNTFTGVRDVDPDLIDAARGMGLTERQTLLRIRLPLATSTIMAGVRTSTVISIGVATLAAFIGAGGLGEPIVTGLYLNDTGLILCGAVPAALLALLADLALGRLERRLRPPGGRPG